ncbi:hypothetical protein [Flavobacterium defluvii]|nr:hypothetical protein [Flavobacterium defluvii]
MKSKVIRIVFAAILLMNLSCTTDDFENEELNAAAKNVEKVNLSEKSQAAASKIIDSLKVNVNLKLAEPDGDPLNPKVK